MIFKLILALLFNSGLSSEDPGFRVPFRFFEPEAKLYDVQISAKDISRYIKTSAPHRSQDLISNQDLSNEILYVSACFKIDPIILTALIHTESTFRNNATSSTGAVGFTQFTNIGMSEVHDQLGKNGKHGAIASTIKFWKNIFIECVNPEWMPLWKRVMHLPEELRKAKQKEILKRDPLLSLSYGALLLKLYWGRQSQLWEERDDRSPKDLYFRALSRYNGEPNGRAEAYAKKVLDRSSKLFEQITN